MRTAAPRRPRPARAAARRARARRAAATQIRYCGESTLPRRRRPRRQRGREHQVARRRRPRASSRAGRPRPAASSEQQPTPAPSAAGCSRPSERWLATLEASPSAEPVERRGAPGRQALDLHRAVEVVADRVDRARGDTASAREPRRPATRRARARRCQASRRRRRATSQASATGAATSGKPFVIAPRPSTAMPGRGRRAQSSSSAPSVSAIGARSKCVRTSAPQSSGISAAASMARRAVAPGARRQRAAEQHHRRRQQSVQPAKASRKVSSPVPTRPGSAIAGAASGGYSKKTSRYGSAAVEHAARRSVRYTKRSFTRSSDHGRDPEGERPAGSEQGQRRRRRRASCGDQLALGRRRRLGVAARAARAPRREQRHEHERQRTRRRTGRTSASRPAGARSAPPPPSAATWRAVRPPRHERHEQRQRRRRRPSRRSAASRATRLAPDAERRRAPGLVADRAVVELAQAAVRHERQRPRAPRVSEPARAPKHERRAGAANSGASASGANLAAAPSPSATPPSAPRAARAEREGEQRAHARERDQRVVGVRLERERRVRVGRPA